MHYVHPEFMLHKHIFNISLREVLLCVAQQGLKLCNVCTSGVFFISINTEQLLRYSLYTKMEGCILQAINN